MKEDLFVLLGDVISSKKLPNRENFQNKLINGCNIVNRKYKPDIYSYMNIIKGSDEIGVVLKDISKFYSIINEISQIIGPNLMRFVLVKGQIDTGLDQREISRMDGPAFHRASNLMNQLKDEKLIFKMDTGDQIFDKLVINNINLIYLIEKKWSSKKASIINEYEKTGDQRRVAEKYSVKQQDVSYHLNSSNYGEIRNIKTDLESVIKSYGLGENPRW
jgi:hypothetical protein